MRSADDASENTVEKQAAARMSAAELLTVLHSSAKGLSPDEAGARRATSGPNALTQEHQTALRILGRQFTSALIYVLIVAAVLSFASQDLSDGVIITAILLINAGLGFSQEYRSERAVEKLSHLISHTVLVTRAGTTAPLDVAELVPGDVVILKEGDVVPADVKLLTADTVQVDESLLTGESAPVPKAVAMDTASPTVDHGDASVLFAGSTLDTGEATGVVYAIGNATALGQIAALSTSIRKVTQYEKSLRAFSRLLMTIIGAALALTLALKLVLGGVGGGGFAATLSHLPLLFVFIIALAVAVVPEALPVIATLTLSRGALQLAKQQVVVKRLSSLEDLGNVTLLCTDKTGTLTENRLTIQHLVSTDDALFQRFAAATIQPTGTNGAGTQSAFDAAFAAYLPDDVKRQVATLTIVKELPFDPAARRRRVVLADAAAGTGYLVVIGAVETLLQISACAASTQYQEIIAAEGQQGLRHLAIAYKTLASTNGVDIPAQESGLTFLGFVTLADPLRASTPQTIATARELGVAIKVLTGDSVEVAAYVARQVGLIPDGGRVYAGDELAAMSPDEMKRAVSTCNVFARVSPEQKVAIIGALKEHDVVGYQGDGINDAPALKLADVGIAVDSATDVAKANADIILLNKDLKVIINGITSGRTIFANINKYIKYTMVGNFGNFFALALLYLLSTDLPLLARQVLLISLLTDVPLVAISTDTVSTADLQRPDAYNARALLSISLVLGSLTALFELVFFATLHGKAVSTLQTNMYLFLSLTQLIVILSIRNREHFWKATRPSTLLIGAMGLTALLAVAIPYLSPVAQLFSFSALPLLDVGMVILIVAVYVLALDLVKVAYYRLLRKERAAPTASVQRPELVKQ